MRSDNPSSDASPDGPPLSEEHRFILDMLAKGKISAVEALQLIQSLPAEAEDIQAQETGPSGLASSHKYAYEGSSAPGVGAGQVLGPDWIDQSHRPPLYPGGDQWQRWWQVPLWIGVGVTVAGALLSFLILVSAGLGFWFFCLSVPFWLGVALIALAWGSRTARWVHIRVDQRPGEWPRHIALSLPIPLNLATWFLRTFGGWIPGLQGTSIDEVLTALETSTSSENPVFIDVQDGEDGERVQVYIG